MISRRALLAAGASLAVSRPLRAATRPPVLIVSHGAPLFMPGQETRRRQLSAWGERLPPPSAIIVMTPHYGTRALSLGQTGPGFAWYDLPNHLKRRLPQDLEYPSPPATELAEHLEATLGHALPHNLTRRGLDHTTWMPLLCLYPRAAAPVLELSFPYHPDPEIFALGHKLAPLRDAGVLFLASGGFTHNLALDLDGPTPSFAREFDDWARDAFARRDADALLDWRARAPAAELNHPDDGGHFRVALFALGAALGSNPATAVSFPIAGFDGGLSIRCVEIGG